MSDKEIEQEIIAKGKTAPRVTAADIEANIDSTHYFTAADGVEGEDWDNYLAILVGHDDHPLRLLTFCVLVLKNGFTVTGESACASPENFDAEIGRKVARDNAVQKIWPLMGYALKQRLHEATNVSQQPAPGAAHAGYSTMAPHQQRVLDEQAELQAKIRALDLFSAGDTFAALPVDERMRLVAQSDAMKTYHNVLLRRIAAF
jgi:hypothetical protein